MRTAHGQRWRTLCWLLVTTALSGLLLLTPSPRLSAAGGPANPGRTARVEGHRIQLALTAPQGPYFLGELLLVTITLSNLSPGTVFLTGPPTPGPCSSAAGVEMSGGRAPFVRIPTFSISCPPGMSPGPALSSGHHVLIPVLIPLTASGAVTMTAAAALVTSTVGQNGQRVITGQWDPFGGRYPAIALSVSPAVPRQRRLGLIHLGPVVLVRAPLAARPHLVSTFVVSCHDPTGPGGTGTGMDWRPLPGGVAYDPGCPGVREQWTIAVGAPGYAVAVGTYLGRGEAKL